MGTTIGARLRQIALIGNTWRRLRPRVTQEFPADTAWCGGNGNLAGGRRVEYRAVTG